MSQEIQTIGVAESMLTVIERAAKDPNVDVSKMESLLAMQEKIMEHQREIAFNEAMGAMEPQIQYVPKTKQGHNAPYAPNEEVDKTIRPLLRDYGFSLSFTVEQIGASAMFVGTLTHKFGHSRRAMIPFVSDKGGSKNENQALGSATSYMRRYTTMMLLNIIAVGEDDDANSTEPISEDQAVKIEMLIKACGADESAFLSKVMRCDSVRSIQRRDFAKAEAQLTKKFKIVNSQPQ